MAGFILSPHDSNTIYHGLQYLFKSTDCGENWERISPDLSHNNPEELGDVKYQTIFTISESPLKKGLIYVGTDCGRAHVTKDDGKNWNVLGANLPSVYVHDIIIYPCDNIIVIATHGRGMWAMDANPINGGIIK